MRWDDPSNPSNGRGNPFSNNVEDDVQVAEPIIDRNVLISGFKRGPNGYSESDLEAIARRLHTMLWKKRQQIWAVDDLPPLDAADPHVALAALGFKVESAGSLGQFQDGRGTVEVAGLFDADNRRIQISQRLQPSVALFTLAHELGHLVCGAKGGVHRDRALDGSGAFPRAPEEHEADKFAAFFLMPAKPVCLEFQHRFLAPRFELNEEVAFALGFESSKSFRRQCATRRHIAMYLACAKQFNGRHFMSMVETFGVSAVAMARRLEELDIVPYS